MQKYSGLLKLIGLPLLFLSLAIISCSKFEPAIPSGDELLDGPVDGLSKEELFLHLKGDEAFNERTFTARDGLGPLFVASRCGSCHAGDGKGHPSTTLIRFGQVDSTGNNYLGLGGHQLQNRAIPGFKPEKLPVNVAFSRFSPPAVTGLGFLDLVPDEAILERADPHDANGDGISGRPNWIHLPKYVQLRESAVSSNGRYIGRFGLKASVYDLLQQTAGAYNQDMGITSVFEPVDTYSGLDSDPEVSQEEIHQVVFYLKTLKNPPRRNPEDAEVKRGEAIFKSIGCESCHRQTFITAPSKIAALSGKQIHPYTDLLLHDMGQELDDGYTEGTAFTSEWRTAPLWGLGLAANSQGGNFYLLHDGRARSIEEAIEYHGGEAAASRQNYRQLDKSEKLAIITFLKSL